MADELIAWLDWAPAYEREHGRRHGEAERLETRVAFPRAPVVSQDGSFPPRTRRPLADGYDRYPELDNENFLPCSGPFDPNSPKFPNKLPRRGGTLYSQA